MLITSDDQTDWEMQWMPKTRRLLGLAGTDVTDFINPHPLCCPARAEIMTGEYAQNNGVRHNAGPYGGYPAFVRGGNLNDNLATWLHDSGYATAMVGKTLNGFGETAPFEPRMGGWDHWNPTLRGTYSFYNTEFANDGDPQRFPDTYVADVDADYARSYIDEFAGQDKPFFLWVSHIAPHVSIVGNHAGPPIPAHRYANAFTGLQLPTTRLRSYMEADMSDKPSEIRQTAADRAKDEDARMRKLFVQRIRSLQAVDDANAAVIEELRRTGELDNTVVMYTSDNGYLLGEHGLDGKNYPYDDDLQIPFLIRGPGVPAGATLDQRLTTVDIAPTVLSYAGILDAVRARGRTDGLDMRPVLAGDAHVNATQLIQAGTDDPAALAAYGWSWRGVTTERYTYAHWWTGEEELYDNLLDPQQLDNVADDPAYARPLGQMRFRLAALADCHGVLSCQGQQFPPSLPPTPAPEQRPHQHPRQHPRQRLGRSHGERH